MKVLIIGGYDYFSRAILMRLKREKHSTFILCDKNSETGLRSKHKADVEYHFDAFDSNISHIVDDIKPDAIIFMGAYDPIYKWDQSKSTPNTYLSALSNLLGIAHEMSVGRFVYLSASPPPGSRKATPKEIAVSTGENLCLRYQDSNQLDISVLRMPSVYAVPEQYDESCGELARVVSCALLDQPCLNLPETIDPLYISDAVEAIYRILCAQTVKKTVYSLSSGYVLHTAQLQNLLIEACRGDTFSALDCSGTYEVNLEPIEFQNDYSFHPYMLLDMGIQKICAAFAENKWMEKKGLPAHEKNSTKKGNRVITWLKEAVAAIAPFIENGLLFALTLFAIQKGFPNPALLLIFYMVLACAVFNRMQMFVSVVLSVVYYTFFFSTGDSSYRIVSDYNYIFTVLSIITTGFVVSSLRDQIKTIQKDKDFVIETQEKEIASLNSMLDTSRDIKTELESRLLNHSDSLSKIYEIVSQLDAVETRKVFQGALKVVSDIMHSKDISIYMSGNHSSYFRNVASSTPKARESMSASMKITDYPELYESLKQENVFVNRTLDPTLPVMALAVNTEGEFNVAIFLWSIDFQNLGLYHINLFLVLRMIITNSIARAYQYELATQEQRYLENTNILRREYFTQLLTDQKAVQEETGSPYQLLKITSDTKNLAALSTLLSGSLRTTDYIGIDNDRNVMIILGGTTDADMSFVEKRLAGKGVSTERIAC